MKFCACAPWPAATPSKTMATAHCIPRCIAIPFNIGGPRHAAPAFGSGLCRPGFKLFLMAVPHTARHYSNGRHSVNLLLVENDPMLGEENGKAGCRGRGWQRVEMW